MNIKRRYKFIMFTAAGLLLILGLVKIGSMAWLSITEMREQAKGPDYWPTTGWRTTSPESQGLDSDKLADLLLAIRERNVQIHSLLIIRNGYVVTDATIYPYDGQNVHDMASVTKSVMTTLIGIATDQGKLNLDDKMVSFFPDYTIANLDELKNGITIRHLASMSSGLDCTAEDDELTLQEMEASPDYVQFVLDRHMIWTPGEHFEYCSPAIHLLSPILQQATGQTALDFARQYLFEPLGIQESMWEQDPQGYYDGWGDLSLNPHDMAKLGFLFMNLGKWEDKQIVSRQWVEEATKAHMVALSGGDQYGYGWWMDPATESGYRADGRGGQYIYIFPEWDMVIVTTGGGYMMDEIAELILASFINFEKSLPANPEGVSRLEAAIDLVLQPTESLPVLPLPEMARSISGKTYVFEPNPAEIQSISLEFDTSSEAIIFVEVSGESLTSHKVGLDGVYRFSPGFDGRPSVYRGTWTDAQTFFLEYDGITNNDHAFFNFRFDGDQVEVSVQETAHEVVAQFVGHLKQP